MNIRVGLTEEDNRRNDIKTYQKIENIMTLNKQMNNNKEMKLYKTKITRKGTLRQNSLTI